MKKIYKSTLFGIAAGLLFASCEKTNNEGIVPSAEIDNVIAVYSAKNDTLTGNPIVFDTSATLLINVTATAPEGLTQISGFATGGAADFASDGFIKGFGSWGEDLKVEGFDTKTSDAVSITLKASDLTDDGAVTFQVFDEHGAYSALNIPFTAVADTNLTK